MSDTGYHVSKATVGFGPRSWTLEDGHSLVIGRQSTCDVRVGGPDPGPEDLGVSRLAATLSVAQGRTWVRNESSSQPVFVYPAVGPECVLERRGDIVSLASDAWELVLEGQIRSYRVDVRLEGTRPGGASSEDPITVSPATRGSLVLTARERRILTALCEPLLTTSGRQARPATYKQIAKRLSLAEHSVRNALDALRERLATIGIPGMVGANAKDALARYSVRSGTITSDDLATIPAEVR